MYLKITGCGEPTRLFIAGIHGNEDIITEPIIEKFARNIEISIGRLIISGLSGGDPYISTLEKKYYESRSGMELLELINKYRPRFYLELHSYNLENLSNLTDPERKKRIGVPPFTMLEENVLIGSVSPHIRISQFDLQDFCITLEIPTTYSEKALLIALDIMKTIALSSSRDEIVQKLRRIYPEQIQEAEKKFHEFLKEIRKPSFF
jgi:hypothetical protein